MDFSKVACLRSGSVILLILYMCVKCNGYEFKIGFVGNFAKEAKMMAGAVVLAVDDVNRNYPIAGGEHTLNWTFSKLEAGESIKSVAQMTDLYFGECSSGKGPCETTMPGVTAIVGPEDRCYAEAYVATAWNIPMITYRCSDHNVTNTKFATFARTLPPGSNVANSVFSFLKAWKWNKIRIVGPEKFMKTIETMRYLAQKHKVKILGEERIANLYSSKEATTIKNIVDRTASETRIYVLVTDQNDYVIDMVSALNDKETSKEITMSEYVVVAVNEHVHNSKDKKDFQKFLESDKVFLDRYAKSKMSVLGFRHVFKLTPRLETDYRWKMFLNETQQLTYERFDVPRPPSILQNHLLVPVTAAHAYDAVMVYAIALNKTLKIYNGSIDTALNGTEILLHIVDSVYSSKQGHDVRINEHGNAEGNYSVLSLDDDTSGTKLIPYAMKPIGEFQPSKDGGDLPIYKPTRNIEWLGGKAPRDEPYCGFDNSKCTYTWQTGVMAGTLIGLVFIALIFILRHFRYEQKLASLQWKIDFRDVIITRAVQNTPFIDSHHVKALEYRHSFHADAHENIENPRISVGTYKGVVVAIKMINKKNLEVTRGIRKEFKIIRELRHENLVPCIGACIVPPNICILTQYCARGSLEDILNNPDINLDNMFVASLVQDLIKGMIYLHDSEVISHGNLKSSNCVIDNRWVLQIRDYGLHEFLAGAEEIIDSNAYYKRMLWRAPELLRDLNPPARGTQKGDVYSFGIILYEIIGHNGPFGNCDMSFKDIVEKVKNGPQISVIDQVDMKVQPVFRPPTANLTSSKYIVDCMHECWSEDPDARPDFKVAKIKLKQMQAGLKPNIFDNMLDLMEKYSQNLEGLVLERTQQLFEEKKKTDDLLYRMLPRPVAEQLKMGRPVDAEAFDATTIYFSDIVGFTSLSAESNPMQVVELLNDLYSAFDSIIEHYQVYKVETIGDAYMVVSGLPIRNGDNHAGEIASMALHLLRKIKTFKIHHRPDDTLKLRIGIHSGSVVAGVVGHKMPRFCLFGDTVNTASRMESNGEALKIHISQTTKEVLDKIGGFYIKERGLVEMKGKGKMLTYWLLAEDKTRRVSRQQQPFMPIQLSIDRAEHGPITRTSSSSSIDSNTGLLQESDEGNIADTAESANVPSPTRHDQPTMFKIKYKNTKSLVDERQEKQKEKERPNHSVGSGIIGKFRRLSSGTHSYPKLGLIGTNGSRSDQSPPDSPKLHPEGNGIWVKQNQSNSNRVTLPNLEEGEFMV